MLSYSGNYSLKDGIELKQCSETKLAKTMYQDQGNHKPLAESSLSQWMAQASLEMIHMEGVSASSNEARSSLIQSVKSMLLS